MSAHGRSVDSDGPARTTIYRRDADRRALLTAALRPMTERGKPPEHLKLHDRLAWMLSRAEEVRNGGIGLGGVAAAHTALDLPEGAD